MNNTAVGIIDAQRGFMPAEEGQRLGERGFGELPVNHGERIIPKLNALLGECALRGIVAFTTQDFHPKDTAHFAVTPNYNTTWPEHCVAGTPGAEMHPELALTPDVQRFYKGAEALERGEDDTSYSGYNAVRFSDDYEMGDWLMGRGIKEVILGGLALDYCVKATALDLKQKMRLDVTVLTDATAPVAQETGLAAITEMEKAGIKFATTEELLERLAATAA